MNWLALIGGTVLVAAGGLVGGHLRDLQWQDRIDNCSQDIRLQKTDRCPSDIKDAFEAVKLKMVTKEVEVRDKLIPILTNDSAENQALKDELLAEIAELAKENDSDACARSAAFERRRLQLCRTEGGVGCPAGGSADQGQR